MSSSDPSRTVGERQHLRLVDDATAIEIVFVCASADVEAIRSTLERLELGARGQRVLAGIERSADELRVAVTCSLQPTLFVLCRTAALEPAHARRAVECFGTKRPFSHRLLVAEFDPRRPAGWMNAVRRAFVSMREALAVISGPVEGMLDSGDRNAVRGETRVADPTSAVPVARRPLVMFGHTRAPQGEGDEDPKSWWRDEVGPIPAHVRAPGIRRRLAVVDPRETTEEGGASISDAVLIREASDPPAAARSDALVMPAPSSERPPTRVMRVVTVGVVALVVLGFAIAPVLGASHEQPEPTPSPVAPTVSPEPSRALPSVVEPARPRPSPPTPPASVSPADSVPPPPPSALDRAVAQGRVGRLEGLYVVEGPDRPLDWYSAANTCRARSVDGTRGFRLPSIDELRWLRRRGLVGDGRDQWSGTRVFGRSRQNWVLAARGGLTALDKDASAAYVVCVRGH